MTHTISGVALKVITGAVPNVKLLKPVTPLAEAPRTTEVGQKPAGKTTEFFPTFGVVKLSCATTK